MEIYWAEPTFSLKQIIGLESYYGCARYLPNNGRFFNNGGRIRRFICKRILKKVRVSIEKGVLGTRY